MTAFFCEFFVLCFAQFWEVKFNEVIVNSLDSVASKLTPSSHDVANTNVAAGQC